ncbi:MAG: FAD-dependent oxidoreductase [Gammaproteobacteria bacterium]|nr:FAD-dependent oxidoreductase [Gammaproteobacteria bacterium]MYG97206.1 FAD-dependent oxidoreductase [Gammaproteobacteria bacterium]
MSNGWDREADVVVLGMGAAGCAAAISAADAGASVILLEKMPEGREGGNTRISGGIWYNSLDRDGMATYLRSLCGPYTLPEEIIEVWADETYKNTEWLESLGVTPGVHADYKPEYPEMPGAEFYGGYLGVNGEMGQQLLWKALSAAVRDRGVEVALDTPAKELVTDDDGTVIGVVASSGGQPLRVGARRGVVLATGGFENNPEMVRDYLQLPGSPVWGSPAGTGDGIKMAQKVGADLWHMDNMAANLGFAVDEFEAGMFVMFIFSMGFICVGNDGRRSHNEIPPQGHGHGLIDGDYELFQRRPLHVIFDEATRMAGPISPPREVLPVGWNMLMEGYDWSSDNSVEIEKGWIQKADTLAELAGILGINADGLDAAVASWNDACAAGHDPLGRPAATLAPLATPPYYGFTSAPLLGWTNGGPRRNEKAQVLDPFGETIGRLYAAGTVSSTYSRCKDGGFHIGDALAFGRVAGRNAAAEPAHSPN